MTLIGLVIEPFEFPVSDWADKTYNNQLSKVRGKFDDAVFLLKLHCLSLASIATKRTEFLEMD